MKSPDEIIRITDVDFRVLRREKSVDGKNLIMHSNCVNEIFSWYKTAISLTGMNLGESTIRDQLSYQNDLKISKKKAIKKLMTLLSSGDRTSH